LEIKSSADFVRMTRAALVAAGFVRRELAGTVYFESQNDAPTLVLVHGANDQAGTWFSVAPALARQYRVLIPDLAGHGESEPRSGPLPISLFVEKLESLLQNERNFTMLGNSLGGWLVLLYTLRNQERVTRVILEASGGLNQPLSAPLTARNEEEAMVVLRAVHGPNVKPQRWVIEALLQRATDSPMLRFTEIQEHLIEDRLGELQTPATLIWGADDGVLPLSYAEALQQALPNATLHVLEGAAHIPHMQQPERFLQCLTAIS
jgi:pimeloyl-ACP methyl ester carboxylesterase